MKDTDFFEEIQSIWMYSGQISCALFNDVVNSSLSGIKAHHHALASRDSVVKMMVLLKLLKIESIGQYFRSDLGRLIQYGKDVFYGIKNSPRINWRQCLLRQAKSCDIEGEEISQDHSRADQTRCFIIDDTDMPKTGKRMELLGRIYSHVKGGSILGYKGLNLALWTGATLLHLDFSLHGEAGKKKDQGIRKKDRKKRYAKRRDKNSPGCKRTSEYFEKKTLVAVQMLRRAINKGFRASYILVDSWFFNRSLVEAAVSHGIHLISRPKNNNWKYILKGNPRTISSLSNKFRSLNSRKYWTEMGLYYGGLTVEFQGHLLQLFFYKENKRGSKWEVIATTNLKIGAKKAYQIYQNRWSIEVSYKELKQHLKFGACQSRDFDAQIADATQCLLAYNFLSKYKMIHHYQTIGGLFKEISRNWLSPTLMNRFWNKVMGLIRKLARFVDLPINILRDNLLRKDEFYSKFEKLSLAFTTET